MERTFFQRVRSAFLAGILVFVPLAVTIWVLVALVGFLESAVRVLPDAWQPEALFGFPIPGLGILLALSTVLLLGLATRSLVGRSVILAYERLLGRVPVVSSVYHGVKQLLEALFSTDRGTFRQVVLVEYPRKGVWSVGFLTGESFIGRDGDALLNVFVPTTPNPTSGFYLMFRNDEVRLLDLSVEEAFKLIMSAGIVQPEHKRALSDELPLSELPDGATLGLGDGSGGTAP